MTVRTGRNIAELCFALIDIIKLIEASVSIKAVQFGSEPSKESDHKRTAIAATVN